MAPRVFSLMREYLKYKKAVMARVAARERAFLLPYAEWLAVYKPSLWA